VTELGDPAIARLLSQRVKAAGFTADAHDLEIKGLCDICREGAPGDELAPSRRNRP
jgi:Fe2+ or Zn2+ uptake regulation protein